jgi:cysteine desulfurase
MPAPPIYLDYNATTPILPEVLETMLPWLGPKFGNPGCNHPYGAEATRAIAQAREQVASLLGCAPSEILFTSGGTEANNLATIGLFGVLDANSKLITSTIEHPAISAPRRYLEALDHPTDLLCVDRFGLVSPSDLEPLLSKGTGLVSVMHSNNEVGSIQPIAELAEIAHSGGYLFHTDAAQSVGKTRIAVGELGVDLLSIAGHKLYAPKGIGALYVRSGTPIGPVLRGAGHEGGIRPGTEPVASIVGLGEACRIAARDLSERQSHLLTLRNELNRRLQHEIPGLRLHGHPDRRLPNTLNLGFPGVSGSALLDRCPDIAASTGSACHEDGEEPSKVLTAMGLGDAEALEAVRLTVGALTTAEEITRAAQSLVRGWRALSA